MEENNIDLGKRIKHLRNKNNLTQQQLAELVDCSDKYISLIELGKVIPSLKILYKISNVLKENPEYLLNSDDDSDDIMKSYRRLNKGNKIAVQGLIKNLLEYQE